MKENLIGNVFFRPVCSSKYDCSQFGIGLFNVGRRKLEIMLYKECLSGNKNFRKHFRR